MDRYRLDAGAGPLARFDQTLYDPMEETVQRRERAHVQRSCGANEASLGNEAGAIQRLSLSEIQSG